MTKYHLVLLFFIIMIDSDIAQDTTPSFSDNILKSHLDSAVNTAATKYLKDNSSNGISIGIWHKGKKYSYNYGERIRGSGILPTVNTFYNLGSVAKTFVSLALAEAVIEKKATLSDDIRKYLPPAFPNLQYVGHPIRLIHLANHTSGLPKEFHPFSPTILDSVDKMDFAGKIKYFNTYNQDRLLEDLHHIKPETIPGTKYQYNGDATMLLILLIERIYHQPYETIVTNILKTHFSMHDTKSILSSDDIKRMARGYNDDNEPQSYANYTGYTGGPSMNSTSNDMLKYIEANILENDPAVKLTHTLTWGDKSSFAMGLGWMMDTDTHGKRFVYHDGHTIGGFNTHCIIYPNQELGFIILVNDIFDQDKLTILEKSITLALYPI